VNLKSLSTLQIALGASFAVHAVLLTVRFVDPEGFNRVFQDTPLEVILVNAKTNERPTRPRPLPRPRWPAAVRPPRAVPPARCRRRR
jgi:protein TonB